MGAAVIIRVGSYTHDGGDLSDADVGTFATRVPPNPRAPSLHQGWVVECNDLHKLRLWLKQVKAVVLLPVPDSDDLEAWIL